MSREFFLRFMDSGRIITADDLSKDAYDLDFCEGRLCSLKSCSSVDDALMIAKWVVRDLEQNWIAASLTAPEIHLEDDGGTVYAKWHLK